MALFNYPCSQLENNLLKYLQSLKWISFSLHPDIIILLPYVMEFLSKNLAILSILSLYSWICFISTIFHTSIYIYRFLSLSPNFKHNISHPHVWHMPTVCTCLHRCNIVSQNLHKILASYWLYLLLDIPVSFLRCSWAIRTWCLLHHSLQQVVYVARLNFVWHDIITT